MKSKTKKNIGIGILFIFIAIFIVSVIFIRPQFALIDFKGATVDCEITKDKISCSGELERLEGTGQGRIIYANSLKNPIGSTICPRDFFYINYYCSSGCTRICQMDISKFKVEYIGYTFFSRCGGLETKASALKKLQDWEDAGKPSPEPLEKCIKRWANNHPCIAQVTLKSKTTGTVVYDEHTQCGFESAVDKPNIWINSPVEKDWEPSYVGTITWSWEERDKICEINENPTCEGDAIKRCVGGYYYDISEMCEFGCSNGKCKSLCTPNSIDCQGNNLTKCSTNGDKWVVTETCEYGCSEATCKPAPKICSPKDRICEDASIKECSEDGYAWEVIQECDYGCFDETECSGCITSEDCDANEYCESGECVIPACPEVLSWNLVNNKCVSASCGEGEYFSLDECEADLDTEEPIEEIDPNKYEPEPVEPSGHVVPKLSLWQKFINWLKAILGI